MPGATRADAPNGHARTVRAFILDDHAIVRVGVRSVLEEAGDFRIVGEAGTAPAGIRGILGTRPDVALVDIRLPGGDGIEVIREVRSRAPSVHCLVLTSYADETAFLHAAMAGASGYVLKDLSAEELQAAARAVAAGRSLLEAEARWRMQDAPSADDDGLLDSLTPQERRIVELVARGLTNREIADELSLAEKTVRNYVSNVLAKLGVKNRTQAAAYVARVATCMTATPGLWFEGEVRAS
ncbi:MAG TPA: response regulator transcription factor [Nitriliruptorales bacterium]|nr:response regulator transcription factor [Nitriliruptorales bacterium]